MSPQSTLKAPLANQYESVGAILDCPKFLKVLGIFKDHTQQLDDGSIVTHREGDQLNEDLEAYKCALEEYWKLKLVADCWQNNEKIAIRKRFAQAKAMVDYPELYLNFTSEEGEEEEEAPLVDYNLALGQQEMELVTSAKLFFPQEAENINHTGDFLRILREVEHRTRMERQTTEENILEAAIIIAQISIHLEKISQTLENLRKDAQPISLEYVNVLSRYLLLVIQSLAMKIANVELEAKLAFYRRNPGLWQRFIPVQETFKELLTSLSKSVEMNEAQLKLFQQLGPSFERVAAHHNHIKSQLLMVEEDLRHLHRI